MARAREGGLASLVGATLPVTTGAFDASLAGLVLASVEPGRVVCTLAVTPPLCNSYATLHGGATATLVDVVGTLAILSVDAARPGVSVDMSQTFLSPARVGASLHVEGRCLRAGKRLAFTEVTLRLGGADGAIVATGRHTKALL